MRERIYVRLVPKRRVIFPGNNDRVLEPTGAWVPKVSFWTRRIKAGDVVQGPPTAGLVLVWKDKAWTLEPAPVPAPPPNPDEEVTSAS